jgi:hypothetical protein
MKDEWGWKWEWGIRPSVVKMYFFATSLQLLVRHIFTAILIA